MITNHWAHFSQIYFPFLFSLFRLFLMELLLSFCYLGVVLYLFWTLTYCWWTVRNNHSKAMVCAFTLFVLHIYKWILLISVHSDIAAFSFMLYVFCIFNEVISYLSFIKLCPILSYWVILDFILYNWLFACLWINVSLLPFPK